ncbi:hypothetical protein [Nitrospira sp. BLG_2]|uniref:hypothetical protein n=1 Tax=Nitrospira sp. BLG_2 TaxID=3397507 RepID=UPI003B98FD2E
MRINELVNTDEYQLEESFSQFCKIYRPRTKKYLIEFEAQAFQAAKTQIEVDAKEFAAKAWEFFRTLPEPANQYEGSRRLEAMKAAAAYFYDKHQQNEERQ